MTDDALRVMLAAALERLRAEQLANAEAAEIASDSVLRAAMEAALAKLRDQLEHDPEWMENAIREILSEREHTNG